MVSAAQPTATTARVASALLRYLAIAHYGRGRGEWKQSEYPEFWRDIVQRRVDARRAALSALWVRRDGDVEAAAIDAELRGILASAARDVLEVLYPGGLEPRRSE